MEIIQVLCKNTLLYIGYLKVEKTKTKKATEFVKYPNMTKTPCSKRRKKTCVSSDPTDPNFLLRP